MIGFKKEKQRIRSTKGSVSKGISSQQYYKSQNSSELSLPAQNKSRYKSIILWLFFSTIVVIFILNLYLNNQPNITINSEAFRPKTEYQTELAQQLSRFPNKNKVTLNKQAIVEQLSQKFPEVSDADIAVPILGSRVEADIKVIDPKLIIKSGSNSYIVDERGRAVAVNLKIDNAKFTTINDQTAFEIKVGKQVLSAQQVQFISYIANQAKLKSIGIKELVLPAGTAGELFMYVNTDSYFVKFIMDDLSADSQLGTYLAVLNELSEQGKQPNEYIDARVEGKAFVK